jgi:hypothetical protein
VNVQTTEHAEVAQARTEIAEWLGITGFHSDEALAAAAVARIRADYGLTLHAEWNSEAMTFKTEWTTGRGEAVAAVPAAFVAAHFDHARLLACAGVIEAIAWLPPAEIAREARKSRGWQFADRYSHQGPGDSAGLS